MKSKKRIFNEKISSRMREDVSYNCRFKLYPQPDGSSKIAQRIVADRPIWTAAGWEKSNAAPRRRLEQNLIRPAEVEKLTSAELARFMEVTSPDRRSVEREALRDAAAELASNYDEMRLEMSANTDRKNRERAARRARTKVIDYVNAEYDFTYFITLTLSGADFARDDIETATKKLQTWLRNRVQRCGLKYIIVPEYHKDGKSIHWHGFINDALPVVESGTYIPPGGGRPIKADTVRKKGLRIEDCTVVYNIPDWDYGFTTAIRIYGERSAAAAYIGKYVTKAYADTDGCAKKIGGRYYLHSTNIRTPEYIYAAADYESASGYETENPACRLKIETKLQNSVTEETWCGATKSEWAELYESASTE